MNKIIWPELPSLKKFNSRKEWEEVCWEKLLTRPELFRFLVADRERSGFVKKAYALKMLNSNQTYRTISKETWLSPQTLSSLKKSLAKNEYQSYTEQLKGSGRRRGEVLLRRTFRVNHPRPLRRTKYGTLRMPT